MVYGRSGGWRQNSQINNISSAYFCGEDTLNNLGDVVSFLGDVNGDGTLDFIATAPYNSQNYEWAGKIYLFTGTSTSPIFHTISGHVKLSDGSGLSGVTIKFSDGSSEITDDDGFYKHIIPKYWTGTATPSKDDFVFDPQSRSYSNIDNDFENEDYIAHKEFISISGKISYYSNSEPVGHVSILKIKNSDTSFVCVTDKSGNYSADVNYHDSFSIFPQKTFNEDIFANTILSYDAALVARHVVGLDTLNDFQRIAADVDKNGSIQTYDAALIARYVVGLPRLSSSKVGCWEFVPNQRSYNQVSQDQSGQNFTGIILGNVHGQWNPSENLYKKKQPKKIDITKWVKKIGDNLLELSIPSMENRGLLSADLNIRFDNNELKLARILKTDISKNFNLVYNNKNGRIKLSLFGINEIRQKGNLVNILFDIINGSSADFGLILDSYYINDSELTTNTGINDNKSKKSTKAQDRILNVYQNYPNPFNSKTNIVFFNSAVARVRVSIFNITGSEVKTLINQELDKGIHRLQWDGTNNFGEKVTSGIYICRIIKGNTQEKDIKLLFLK